MTIGANWSLKEKWMDFGRIGWSDGGARQAN